MVDVVVDFEGWGNGTWGDGGWGDGNYEDGLLSADINSVTVRIDVSVVETGFAITATQGNEATSGDANAFAVGFQSDLDQGVVTPLTGTFMQVTGILATATLGNETTKLDVDAFVSGFSLTATINGATAFSWEPIDPPAKSWTPVNPGGGDPWTPITVAPTTWTKV